MDTKKVIFKPELVRQRRINSDESARESSVIGKHNISNYFTQLYGFLYEGKVRDGKRQEIDIVLNDGVRNFHPDLICFNKNGKTFVEIKAASVKNGEFYCPVRQLENYCYSLIKGVKDKKGIVGVDYAFFKYGDSHRLKHLTTKGNAHLVDVLTEHNKYVTVLPLNLVLFLVPLARYQEMDQTTSSFHWDSQNYIKIPGGLIRKMHNDKKFLEELKEQFKSSGVLGRDNVGDFFLDDLKFERKRCEGLPVEYYNIKFMDPFFISKYYFPNGKYQKWLGYFYQNHERILTGLGLDDLFVRKKKELAVIPF
jgi:hypothetical protein